MTKKGEDILLPDNPVPYLTDWLFEIGPVLSGGMGARPLELGDLPAWEHFTGIELDAWEARTIVRLSAAFSAQRHKAEKPDCPPPYCIEAVEAAKQEDKVAGQFKAMMAAMGKRG